MPSTQASADADQLLEQGLALAVQLYRDGRLDEAAGLCDRIIACEYDTVDARILRAAIHEKTGSHLSAVNDLLAAIRTRPRLQDAERNNGLGFSYAELAEIMERNLRREFDQLSLCEDPRPGGSEVNLTLAIALHAQGRLEEARRQYHVCKEWQDSHHFAVAYTAIIDQQEGEDRAFQEVIDYDAHVHAFDLAERVAAPELERFNRALVEAVQRAPSFQPERHVESPYAKYVTDNLNEDPVPAVRRFRDLVQERVDGVIASLGPIEGHPYYGAIPEAYDLYIFGAWLESGGFHSPHVHSQGWMSGVYYAQVPDFDVTGNDDRSGCLEFGRSPFEEAIGFPTCKHRLRPREDQLIMWPSYYLHSTVPCATTRPRVTMGFDVVPRRAIAQ